MGTRTVKPKRPPKVAVELTPKDAQWAANVVEGWADDHRGLLPAAEHAHAKRVVSALRRPLPREMRK